MTALDIHSEELLSQISKVVPRARTLEELTRPLLELIQAATGLESTYLTTINLNAGVQHVNYALNTGTLQIPEGLNVPWEDTLCKRALEENRLYTGDVADCWGDSDAASALGIQTYLSVPVRTPSGSLLGTLCAASSARIPLALSAQPVLTLFAWLIADLLERERLLEDLRTANATLTTHALTDALTGLPNRRAVAEEFDRIIARAKRDQQDILVGLIDLDNFKSINDTHGHQAGDELLSQAAQRMRNALRGGDLLGRIGGDEFIVLAPGPLDQHPPENAASTLERRLAEATTGTYRINNNDIYYTGASVGVVVVNPAEGNAEHALRLADLQMYKIKKSRKSVA
jgi:diguanylate cyclase